MSLNKTSHGRVPDLRLVRQIERLFDEPAAKHVLPDLLKRDLFAGALTGNRAADSWRTWRAARVLIAQGRSREAIHQKLYPLITDLYPRQARDDSLVDVELLLLFSESFIEEHNPAAAFKWCQITREQLFNFVRLMQTHPHGAADEVREMFRWVAGIYPVRKDLSDGDLLDAWIIGRGLDVLLTISLHMVNMVLLDPGQQDEARRIAENVASDVVTLHGLSGCAFTTDQQATIEFTLGNCWTDIDPERALHHFITSAHLRSSPYTEVNAANCLVQLQRYDEARTFYRRARSVFEMEGNYLSAARTQYAECIATWDQTHDLSVRRSLVEAISLFENNLPPVADQRSLHMLKKIIGPAYRLLITVISESNDRSEERLNELLGSIWALLSRDFKANLDGQWYTGARSRVAEKTTSNAAAWSELLNAQQRPLAAMKTLLAPFPGAGIVHLCSANHCLVWVAYGFDLSGQFRFETSPVPFEQIDVHRSFLHAMYDQLAADTRRDPAGIQRCSEDLLRLGDAIGAQLRPSFVDLLLSMKHLYYMPLLSQGDMDLFPLAGLRIGGAWLNAHCTITRLPTINHLREMLAPTYRPHQANARATIVTGDPAFEEQLLRHNAQEAARVQHVLGVYGFHCELAPQATAATLHSWLNGEVGIIHYIGHGYAHPVTSEGLPLTNGEVFEARNLAKLTGINTPFVFLCACETGRIRYGGGGYQIGLASRLTERGAPAVLAFNMPVPEASASAIAHSFYKHAFRHSFGEAVRQCQQQLAGEVSTYAWLALTAYGDQHFRLAALAGHGDMEMSANQASCWHSDLRTYATLRTKEAHQQAIASMASAPVSLRPILNEFLACTFLDPPGSTIELLDRLEEQALATGREELPGLLSLLAAIYLERAHLIGLDAYPIRWPQSGDSAHKLFFELDFVTYVAATVFDERLSGLGYALMGRLATWDQNNLIHSATYLHDAIERLAGWAELSTYLPRIHQESIRIIQQFGGNV
jgi:hypothetical protein